MSIKIKIAIAIASLALATPLAIHAFDASNQNLNNSCKIHVNSFSVDRTTVTYSLDGTVIGQKTLDGAFNGGLTRETINVPGTRCNQLAQKDFKIQVNALGQQKTCAKPNIAPDNQSQYAQVELIYSFNSGGDHHFSCYWVTE